MESSRVYSSTEPLPPLEQILNPSEMTCPPYAEEVGLDCSPWVFQKKEKVTPEEGRERCWVVTADKWKRLNLSALLHGKQQLFSIHWRKRIFRSESTDRNDGYGFLRAHRVPGTFLRALKELRPPIATKENPLCARRDGGHAPQAAKQVAGGGST